MTLTVNIKFSHHLPLEEIFVICQKAVNTPEGTKPMVTWRELDNPVCGADCAMGVYSEKEGEYEVSLDIPYIAAGEMYDIAQRVLDLLNVTKFSVHNEWDYTWHDNLNFLK